MERTRKRRFIGDSLVDNSCINQYLKQTQKIYGDKLYLKINKASINNSSEEILDKFYHSINNCKKCQMGNSRNNFVFGVGDKNADLLLVGEAPGEREDLEGVPFVGRAGKLLDKILAAISLSRDKGVFICNVLKCRPPDNRDPLLSEIEQCEPYLKEQINLIKPKLIVALGRVA